MGKKNQDKVKQLNRVKKAQISPSNRHTNNFSQNNLQGNGANHGIMVPYGQNQNVSQQQQMGNNSFIPNQGYSHIPPNYNC